MEKVYLVTEDRDIRWGVDMSVVGVFTSEDMAEAHITLYGMNKRDDIHYTITPMTLDFPVNDTSDYPCAWYEE